MSGEDTADEPSSDLPESSHDGTKGGTEDNLSTEGTDYITDESLKTPGIFDLLNTIYHDRYYWEILKSTIMFIFALKLARECNMMHIPIRQYKPFNKR